MQRVVHESGVVYYRSERLMALGVRHGFSTRLGGVSQGRFSTLNLGNPLNCPAPDPESNLERNYHRLSVAAGLSTQRVAVHQVHGNAVLRLAKGEPAPASVQADAIVSDDPFRCVSIRTADCAAVLLASAGGRVIGAVHAGWRGVVAGVVTEAARAMADRGAPAVAAAVFPCISFPQFEVGLDVVDAFRRLGLPAYVIGNTGKGRAGVAEGCVMQLEHSGVPRQHIDVSTACTFSNPSDFFSHRRDGAVTGRMALLALPAGTGDPVPGGP
jgi:YfiH family protein